MKKLNQQSHQTKEMSFRDMYFALGNTSPKAAFVQKIAKITRKSESAVRGWVYGAYAPDALAQEIIEKELGVSAEILFPKEVACVQ